MVLQVYKAELSHVGLCRGQAPSDLTLEVIEVASVPFSWLQVCLLVEPAEIQGH